MPQRHIALSLLTLIACLGLGAWPAAAKKKKAPLPPADEILERAWAAASRGDPTGPVVYRMHGRMSLQGQPLAAMSSRTVPGEWLYMRIVSNNGFAMDMGIEGDLGWEISSQSLPRLVEDQDLLMIRSLMLPDPNLDPLEFYASRKTLGVGTAQGEAAYKVKLVDGEGVVQTSFFSVESGLLLATKGIANLGVGPMPFSTSYGDYRDVNGSQIPFEIVVTIENIRTELLISEFFVTDDDPARPALPLPIQALVAMEGAAGGANAGPRVAHTALVPTEAAAVRFALGTGGVVVPATGDLDGDGKAELVFAVHRGGEAEGDRILMFDGPFSGEVGPADAFAGILGGGARLMGDWPVAIADLDGDGTDDLAGIWNLGDDGSALCLVHGPLDSGESGTDACDAWFTFPAGVDGEGACLHSGGDVTGDGIDDMLVGDRERGLALVLPGRTDRYTGTTPLAAAAVVQLSGAGGFGSRLAVADADADGLADLWISAPDLDEPRAEAGAIYLFRGPIGAGTATAGPTSAIHAGLSRRNAGLDLDAGGDLDGDGQRELLVLASHPELGGDAVVLEPWPAVDRRELAWMTTRIAAVALTDPVRRVRTIGDVDGDGFEDVMLGVPDADGQAGRAYLIYGPLTHAMTLTEAPVLFESPGPGRRFGGEIVRLGDMNDDGRDDLLITAISDPSAFLYLGTPRPKGLESTGDAPSQTAP
jgi:hypothetical protein